MKLTQSVCAELTSIAVSLNSPVVTLSPVTGTISDTLTACWIATDADEDDLVVSVYFSADAGETWESMAINLEYNEVELDTTFWPATEEGMLHVVVSDHV